MDWCEEKDKGLTDAEEIEDAHHNPVDGVDSGK